MCPKTNPDERVEIVATSADDVAERDVKRRSTSKHVPRRAITKSGAFPKRGGADKTRPQKSASEEVVLIGVETSKASRYTFIAPRSGKKRT